MQFLEDSKQVHFDEASHKYTIGDKKLISVTTFISEFSNPFDPDNKILERCAIREKVAPAVLKKRWDDKGTKAGEIGHHIHENIQKFINTGKIKKDKYSPIVKNFQNFKFKGKLFSEVLLFEEELGISGTSDLIQIIDDKTVQCHDLKTNEKKPTDYSFGRYMKYPIAHLNDSKLMHYFLQVSLYLYILHSKYGYEIGENNFIFWINRKKNDIIKIPVELKMTEICDMIAYYTYLKSMTPDSIGISGTPNNTEELID